MDSFLAASPGCVDARWGLDGSCDKVMAEYIYIVNGIELQSKTVVLEGGRPQSADALPPVELSTERGEVYLQPRSIYADPLRGGDHILVLCEAHVPPQLAGGDLHSYPHAHNMRAPCAELDAAAAAAGAAFTVEQEYAVLDPFTGLPPGVFPAGVPMYIPGHQQQQQQQQHSQQQRGGRHSCCESGSMWGSPASAGGSLLGGSYGGDAALAASLSALPGGAAAAAQLLLGAAAQPQHPAGSPAARRARQLSELHMRACIKAGLRYAGASPPAGGGAAAGGGDCWAYKIGPCAGGAEMGDQVSVSRFLLRRLGEDLDVSVSFSPAAQPGAPGQAAQHADPSAARSYAPAPGCSVEFSTAATRAASPDAMGEMQRMLTRLQAAHPAHAPGLSAAAAAQPFSVAVGDRRASVTIPTSTLVARCGPFVDRRAAGDADPYLAASLLTSGALGLPLPAAAARALGAPPCRRVPAPAAAGPFKPAFAAAAGFYQPSFPAAFGAGAAAFGTADAAQALLKHQQHQQQRAAAANAFAPAAGGLASALNAALAAGRLAAGPAATHSAQPFGGASCSGGCGSDDFDGSDAGDFGSECEASDDMLISEIRRMDRQARRAAKGVANGDDDEFEDDDDDYEDEEDDSASSAMASSAGSPAGGLLAAACRGACDMEMAAA